MKLLKISLPLRHHKDLAIRIKGFLFLFITAYYSLFTNPSFSQTPTSLTSSEILQQIKKLKVLGSVLYIAAHPDDENTRLLAWLANEKQYRTGYLSLTRGDGGQNLLGDEQGTELGLIRTQELLAARRMDGAEQFFSRAYDFGFSKNPEETFRIWDRDKILSDAVWVIRKFQPDVIITRFPEDGRGGHGHHTASAIIAREAFDAAADPKRFPEQFKYGVKPWQAKRLFWNGFGNAAEGQTISVDVGGYNPLLGKSYGEIAADSRTNHKSQGFGSARNRGTQRENLTLIKGDAPDSGFMGGIDVSWKRANSETIERKLEQVIQNYRPSDPSASVPQLSEVYFEIRRLDNTYAYWREEKLTELKEIILAASGLYLEAISAKQYIAEGDTLRYSINAINRSNINIKADLSAEISNGAISDFAKSVSLVSNVNIAMAAKRKITETFMSTQPYWLRLGMEKGTFNVTDQQLIGLSENEPISATVGLIVNNLYISVLRPIFYKTVDPVKGELYNPVIITPEEKIYSNNNLVLFRKGSQDSAQIVVTVVPEETTTAQKMSLQLMSNKFVSAQILNYKPVAGVATNYTIKLGNYLQPSGAERDTLKIQLQKTDTREIYANASRTINYDHIPTLNYFYRDAVQVLNIDLKTAGNTIGYIPGAGDKVPDALRQMGYTVTELSEATITPEMLKTFDAVITGVRAYDVNPYIAGKHDILMSYVQNGGNLIVQYNRNNTGTVQSKIGPYPFAIANKRITEEDAPVNFELPAHPALNYPNKIAQKDFAGWVQERSTYQAEQIDSHYEMPLTMHDTGEAGSNGSLMIGKYGKGNFVYASLVFFRELPAGIPGAYRLLANLIALGK